MRTQHVDGVFRIKAAGDDGVFEGHGSVFNVKDDYDEIVAPGAFADSLAAHKAAGTMPAMLWQHQPTEPIGAWLEMAESDHGLAVRGRLLVGDDPLARRAYAHLKAGSVSGLSIGFVPRRREVDDETGDVRLLQVDLWEVSIVTFPANPAARVTDVRASEVFSSAHDLEAEMRLRFGFTRRLAKRCAAACWPIIEARDVRDAADDENALGLIEAIERRIRS